MKDVAPSLVDAYTRSLDCVHCGLCLPVCPTYRVLGLETDSPRGRIYLMRALAEGRIDDPAAIRLHLDQCLDCRACETACPSGVRYGEILETVRADMQRQSPAPGWKARLARFLLWRVVARQARLRLAFRLARLLELTGLRWLAARTGLLPRAMDRLIPRVPPGPRRRPIRPGLHRPAGAERGRVALFTGCVMEQLFGDVNRATLDLLLANGFAVEVPPDQRCCGALLVHNGQSDEAKSLARQNAAAFAEAEHVVVNSAGCGATMKEYGHLLGDSAGETFGHKVRDICQFLAEQGMTTTPARLEARIAYDDPCHLCHAQGVSEAPRQLLARIPGVRFVSHARPADCCGSAGIYNLLQPRLAAEIGRRKIEDLASCDPEFVVTGNPGCMLQIAAHGRALGHTFRVVHPVELLLPANNDQPG